MHNPAGEGGEGLPASSKDLAGMLRFSRKGMGSGAARIDTDKRGEGQFAACGIFADTFADRLFGSFGIEEVIGNLKGEPKGSAVDLQGLELL